ncbi:MAG: FUSC family protein [bacterium]
MLESFLHFRVLKTVIAAFLSLVAASLMLASYPIFTALSACFCIRQTFMGSLAHFFEEIKLATIATMIALLFGGILELEHMIAEAPLIDYFVAALAMGVVVAVAQYYKWYNAIFIGLLTVAYVLLVPAGKGGENIFLARGAARLGHILVGSISALAVDFLFSGFEYKRLFHYRFKQVLTSIDDMMELFVEAIMFQSKEMMDRTLDIMVETQNLLNYVNNKLEDLETELNFRGDNIHGFDRSQLSLLQDILRDFRIISFQLESGAVNYIELLNIMEKEESADAFPEADYARISSKGRALAGVLSSLQQAVDNEEPVYLEKIISCEVPAVDYRYLFEEMESADVKLLAIDTLSSIGRIEYHLCKSARLIHEYLSLRKK